WPSKPRPHKISVSTPIVGRNWSDVASRSNHPCISASSTWGTLPRAILYGSSSTAAWKMVPRRAAASISGVRGFSRLSRRWYPQSRTRALALTITAPPPRARPSSLGKPPLHHGQVALAPLPSTSSQHHAFLAQLADEPLIGRPLVEREQQHHGRVRLHLRQSPGDARRLLRRDPEVGVEPLAQHTDLPAELLHAALDGLDLLGRRRLAGVSRRRGSGRRPR